MPTDVCEIVPQEIPCTMRTVDPWGISVRGSDSSLFPRFGNGIVKRGYSQQSLTHLKLRCCILLGLLGSLHCHWGWEEGEGEALAENTYFSQTGAWGGRVQHCLEYLQMVISSMVWDQFGILSISHVKFSEVSPTLTDFYQHVLLSPEVCTRVCAFTDWSTICTAMNWVPVGVGVGSFPLIRFQLHKKLKIKQLLKALESCVNGNN